MRHVLILIISVCVTGCAGVGLIETADPNVKLHQAYILMDEDRALMSEDLIRQAMDMYKNKISTEGVAEAYFAYGNLYKHPTYHRHSAVFKRFGTYDGSYNKSIENYVKAMKQFEITGSEVGVIKSIVSIGEAYNLKNEDKKSCSYYAKAKTRYEAAKKSGAINKEPKILVNGANNIGQIITALMERESCT